MPELHNFASIVAQCENARAQFHACAGTKLSEIDVVFTLLTDVIHSVGRLYDEDELKGTRREAAMEMLIQGVETVVAMYFMAEDGFWDASLALKRNYAELLLVAVAIGYDEQCFIDWKHERSKFDGFSAISKRVEKSSTVPAIEKEQLLPHLKRHWNDSSRRWSHNIARASIRTVRKDGQIRLEPKLASSEFEERRLNTIRNMLSDVLSVLLGIIDFDRRANDRRATFPEGRSIIARVNSLSQNNEWKQQPTS